MTPSQQLEAIFILRVVAKNAPNSEMGVRAQKLLDEIEGSASVAEPAPVKTNPYWLIEYREGNQTVGYLMDVKRGDGAWDVYMTRDSAKALRFDHSGSAYSLIQDGVFQRTQPHPERFFVEEHMDCAGPDLTAEPAPASESWPEGFNYLPAEWRAWIARKAETEPAPELLSKESELILYLSEYRLLDGNLTPVMHDAIKTLCAKVRARLEPDHGG